MLALLFASAIVAGRVSEHVDVIELNHYYDACGKLVYDQVIAWERSRETGKLNVRSWRMAENDYPIRINGVYRFSKGEILIHSSIYRESWTQSDPERENGKRFPNELRIELVKDGAK
jgi:hypothetical protein